METDALQRQHSNLVRQVREAEARVQKLKGEGVAALQAQLALGDELLEGSTVPAALQLTAGVTAVEVDLANHPAVKQWDALPRDHNFSMICERVTALCKDLNQLHKRVPECITELDV
eukprot:TRINITY_DN2100_c0_g1_i8.p3 TRINITY_DN2100_c0_g1~~TRINITY_DN2100_c0_g1_i8.p3  ORF type:complete len:117 (-),score=30.94 TRINITY_DN2100_c0_g1_i8:246-596(-)